MQGDFSLKLFIYICRKIKKNSIWEVYVKFHGCNFFFYFINQFLSNILQFLVKSQIFPQKQRFNEYNAHTNVLYNRNNAIHETPCIVRSKSTKRMIRICIPILNNIFKTIPETFSIRNQPFHTKLLVFSKFCILLSRNHLIRILRINFFQFQRYLQKSQRIQRNTLPRSFSVKYWSFPVKSIVLWNVRFISKNRTAKATAAGDMRKDFCGRSTSCKRQLALLAHDHEAESFYRRSFSTSVSSKTRATLCELERDPGSSTSM